MNTLTEKETKTMSDVEKIYCEPCGSGDNGNCMAMWSMLNQNQQWNNNPFIYFVWMMMMRYWGNGNGYWNGEGANYNNSAINTAAIQDQLTAFRNQMADNQNSNLLMNAITGNGNDVRALADKIGCDFNALSAAVSGVKSAIDLTAGQIGFSAELVINAVNLGDSNIISTLQNCCCENKMLAQKMGYESQLATERQTGILGSKLDSNHAASTLQACQNTGAINSRIDQMAHGMTEGFASLGYQASQNTNSIITAINAAQQRTSDQLSNHWTTELSQALQDSKFEISQLKQNQYIHSLINGNNNGCGCGGI